jgi:RNA polymerase sigma-70 factor (ECF subfamily)
MKYIARKDRAALRELMRRHEQRVRRIAFRYTGSDDAASELVQDVFFKVYTSAGSYSPRARFTTWLYRITANHCLNFLRNAKKNPLQNAACELEGPAEPACAPAPQLAALEKNEVSEQVARAMSCLPERQRLAILLLRFEELPYREAAEALGCSVSALEALVHRGFETLKKQLLPSYKGD